MTVRMRDTKSVASLNRGAGQWQGVILAQVQIDIKVLKSEPKVIDTNIGELNNPLHTSL
ncbi:MAG: hypothetical protein UU63_C0042G0004 [Candidatus Uhrbacteria bacterium GW2011_GWF2_41_430]|nr:MAG: hypothetical protein UU63_C0042G0004 [Candidatus Uhrbacteria bacterium GW2011_GWF2_41_430]